MEHSTLLHYPFAKGRIENGLAPAPRRISRPFHRRVVEAVSILMGRSIGVTCYFDMLPPSGEKEYVDGSVGRHPLRKRKSGK